MKKRTAMLLVGIALLGTLSGCTAQERSYGLDAGRIQADTQYLCEEIGDRPTGTEKERGACDWLEGQLEEIGFSYDAGTLQRVGFEGFPGMTSENLIAVCNRGSDGPVLCVMAHYDSVEGSPGARDNGSAVCTLLELARYLGAERADLDAEVRILLLGSEENGYHGASAYVEGLSQEERERHLAAFNLENSAASPGPGAILLCGTMGGIQDGTYQEGNFLEPMENIASQAVSRAYQERYGGEALPVFHMGGSDHRIFHQAEIPAVNLCWKYIREDGFPTVPEEYHQPTDTPEGMDFDTAVITGSCVLDALYQLADAAEENP